VRGLSELVFSTTNRCTAKCEDCPIVPSVDPPARIKYEDMIRIVDQVRSWGSLRLVVFTGGEAFLLGKDLRSAVAYAAQSGILTRIVTNAYWAKSRDRAVRVLAELKEAGLSELNISCDDYHQAFVPLDNVRNANAAAAQIGLPALLVHRQKPGGEITPQFLSKYFGVELRVWRQGGENPDNNVICTSRNVPIRATRRATDAVQVDVQDDDRQWTGACKSVLRSIVVFPDLSVQICCGIALSSIPELTIGSLSETDLLEILKRGNQDLIANWLALEGPSSILSFVREKDPDIRLPSQYVGRCHLCNELFTNPRVRKVLAEHAEERRDGLLMMRGVLDWISEDWAPSTQCEAQHASNLPHPQAAAVIAGW
jgi:hypothetical protein